MPWDLDKFTSRDFALKYRGFKAIQDDKSKEAWHIARWQVSKLITPHLKKGAKLKETDLILFPWERKSPSVDVREFVAQHRQKFAKLPPPKKGQYKPLTLEQLYQLKSKINE